ncbi:MAG: arginine--tRNA ligase [Candidatus Omnitrophica bacterium]|nr:arginine--tRNA ligase [Candidatus Omnitrophota bacterium]
MEENIQDLIADLIRRALSQLDLDETSDVDIELDFPSDARFGDFSTNLPLQLSKLLKRPPKEIASEIVGRIKEALPQGKLGPYIKEIKTEGAGFINFYLEEKYFLEQLAALVKKGKDGLRQNLGKGRKVLIEFVSANPTGWLSVAHARQAAVGDCLGNILSFLGFEVKKEYYLNDEGNQIEILGRSVELRMRELDGEKIEFPENYYQGDYIYDIAKKAKNEEGKITHLGDYAAQYILGIIKKELYDFGVTFDYWYSQKQLRESGKIDEALGFLKQKGYIYEEDGALWFKSSAFGDDKDRVVVKSDGSYTYLAPDIAYHQDKYKRSFQWLINLWGPDHHGYINRLKAAVEALGYPADSLSIIIVQLSTIFRNGRPIQMSTRKGQYITLREVLTEVGRDAFRFFFLMRRTSSHLDFDLDIAKKETAENPVYYIQYAYARICSILRSAGAELSVDVRWQLLTEDEEVVLIKKILRFPVILRMCLNMQDPFMLTVYLQELAEAFHKFYDQHRVLVEDKELSAARLMLIKAVRIILDTGLELMNVSRPEKM